MSQFREERPKSRHPNLDDRGYEILSPKPVAIPAGLLKTPSLMDNIRAMVRSEHLRQAAEDSGFESFEDSDDFEVGDDYDPNSPYEGNFDTLLEAPQMPQGAVSATEAPSTAGAETASGAASKASQEAVDD